jgi:uncharacterized protein YndB with AHSA1/START domain
MAEIRHRVGIAATPAAVYGAVSTTEGIGQWWVPDVKGDPSSGGTLSFYFGGPEPGLVVGVTAATPEERVRWHCVRGPEDWVGTSIEFELKGAEEETVLLLTHFDWRGPSEFMSHCSTKWGYYLLGLKSLLEGGEATPHGQDAPLSKTWH